MDCAFPTNGDIETVIAGIIQAGDSPDAPDINVVSFRPLCLAFGVERDRYRGVSVLVEYTCTGNPNCPSGTPLEQIESECGTLNGVWSASVQNTFENTRRTNPTATLSTNTREDCSFCLSPTLATRISLMHPIFPDDEHHCIRELLHGLLIELWFTSIYTETWK